ncbi:tyrosine-type recombinase/integrase [Embleya sp. NPDC056575]|uniref:tyrosine-type recombinase/integrase n=1 Tax=unclassified Embleya TaxID=2699296 RepID=UPI00367A4B2F
MSGGYIEDRWLKKRPNPKTDKRERTALWGKGKRYRVKGIPGVADRSFHQSGEAKDWLARAKADVRRGEFIDPRDGAISLTDYVENHWLPTHPTRGTSRHHMTNRIRSHILPHLGRYPLMSIGDERLRAWIAAMSKDLDTGTTEVIWTHLSSILKSAHNAGRISRNPCVQFVDLKPRKKLRKKPRAWPRETVDAVRAAIPERHRILVDEGLGAGLRQGEAFGLSPDDIVNGLLLVRRQVVLMDGHLYFAPPKGAKERDVPAPPGLVTRMADYGRRFPPVEVTLPWLDPDEAEVPREERRLVTVKLVVTTRHGNALRNNDWNVRVWKPALGCAGLIKAKPEPEGPPRTMPSGQRAYTRWEPSREWGYHSLRHTFASVQLEAGESPVTLARWLGHASPKITFDYYAHFMPEAGVRGLAAMDGWLTDETEEIVPVESLAPGLRSKYPLPQQVRGEAAA